MWRASPASAGSPLPGRQSDLCRDLLLQRQHAAQVSLVPLSPHVPVCRRTNEFGRDLDARSGSRDGSLDNPVDLQFLANLGEALDALLVVPGEW